MADSGIRTRHFWLPKPRDAHTFVLIKVLASMHGQFHYQGKNADY